MQGEAIWSISSEGLGPTRGLKPIEAEPQVFPWDKVVVGLGCSQADSLNVACVRVDREYAGLAACGLAPLIMIQCIRSKSLDRFL